MPSKIEKPWNVTGSSMKSTRWTKIFRQKSTCLHTIRLRTSCVCKFGHVPREQEWERTGLSMKPGKKGSSSTIVTPSVCGLWFMVYGLWFMVYGLWLRVSRLWPVFCGLWPMIYGLWSMVYCVWVMVYGLWSVIFGFWLLIYGSCCRVEG